MKKLLPIYILILIITVVVSVIGSQSVTVISENIPIQNRQTVILDAGHGGEDGGATSVSGILESRINLEIALRIDDLLHLLGVNTIMIRTEDISVHTEGNTISARKMSDLKNRVQIINKTPNALLISIHQNHFPDHKYSGSQVFYPKTEGSEALAKQMQTALINSLQANNHRQAKKASGVYLMDHILCPGLLIECGFLSNFSEEALLRNSDYQKKLSCVIASQISRYLCENYQS